MLSMLNMVSNFAGLPLYFSFVVILGNTGIFVLALRAIGIQLSTVFRLYSIQGLLLMFISAAPGQPDAGSCFSGSGFFLEGSS